MIWCVEDDSGIREIEVYTLNSTGFQARGFADGASFREALETETPELVLLDVMLPGEDGVSLLRYLRQTPQTRDVPVIMATAKGMEYDKIQSLDMGADDYLVKPFGMMEMVSRISCSTTCGARIMWARAARWICTSALCAKNWVPAATVLRPCGAWAIDGRRGHDKTNFPLDDPDRRRGAAGGHCDHHGLFV